MSCYNYRYHVNYADKLNSGKIMNEEIVKHLNKLLTNELTSVRQYLLHFAVLKNNGINRLAEKVKNELNEELEHAKASWQKEFCCLKESQIFKIQMESQSMMESLQKIQYKKS